MSLSPESFDHLLADKLAQMSPPAYDPAHWDMLEDQLQHLAQHPSSSSSGGQGQPAPAPPAPAPAIGGWLAGPVAKLGLVAALTGVTVVNGYLYLQSQQRAVVRDAVIIPTVGIAHPRVAPEASVPALTTPTAGAPAPSSGPSASAMPAATVRPARPSGHQPLATPTTVTAVSPITENSLGQPAAASPVPAIPVVVPTPVAAVTAVGIPQPAAATGSPALADNKPADSERVVTPTADDAGLNQLAWADIITPDGDGKNDRLELPLPAGTCRLTVFDRTGKVVYANDHYDNSWNASGCTPGIYHYVVETVDHSASPILRPVTVVR